MCHVSHKLTGTYSQISGRVRISGHTLNFRKFQDNAQASADHIRLQIIFVVRSRLVWRTYLSANRLQLNATKTEFLWCSSRQREQQLPTYTHALTLVTHVVFTARSVWQIICRRRPPHLEQLASRHSWSDTDPRNICNTAENLLVWLMAAAPVFLNWRLKNVQ